MNYGSIKVCDTANGPGMRVSLFVSGCTHHCKGCFNQETWDFNYGETFTVKEHQYILSELTWADGLSILGGEPMETRNQLPVLWLIRAAKKLGKNVWLYSGYTFEELTSDNPRCHGKYTDELLSLIDVLVDGPFVLEEKDISLQFRGSRNQRIIDVKKTLEGGRIMLWDGMDG